MEIKELRGLTREELMQKERSIKEELFKLREQRYSGRVEKPHLFSQLKKDVARIRTVLREKKDR